MTLAPADLDRCARAYAGMAMRSEGVPYDGPSADEILAELGYAEPSAEHHRIATAVIEAGEQRMREHPRGLPEGLEPRKAPRDQGPWECSICGRWDFRSAAGLGRHLSSCDGGKRDRQVLEMDASGMSVVEIAAELDLSESTVYGLLSGARRRADPDDDGAWRCRDCGRDDFRSRGALGLHRHSCDGGVRDRRVQELLDEGRTGREIARELGLGEGSVYRTISILRRRAS